MKNDGWSRGDHYTAIGEVLEGFSAEDKHQIMQGFCIRERAKRYHAQIVGLLMGNPAANAAERLRHLHIEGLLAA